MYVAVKGGEAAIAASLQLLDAARRGDPAVRELEVAQIREQLGLLVDRVMAEGSLHDPELAALALKQARGDAMSPLVRPGDRVRLERRAPRTGEVGLISVGGRLVLHRLIRRRGSTWLVHADRPSAPDAWVHARQVIAIATERLRAGEARWTALARERSLGRALRDAFLGESAGL